MKKNLESLLALGLIVAGAWLLFSLGVALIVAGALILLDRLT